MYEKFCQEYVIDFNGTRAAKAVGFGKTRRSSSMASVRLLARIDIQKRISKLMADRSERTRITQDMVLQELAVLGFSDFKHYGQIKNDGSLEFYSFKKIKDEKTRAIQSMKEITGASGRSISLKLHEKVRPLELLGKHLGMFVDTHNVNLTGNIKVISAVPRPRKPGGIAKEAKPEEE